ncbi:MAG: DUF3261 domain-containing protein [Enhygromyxa sp.]
MTKSTVCCLSLVLLAACHQSIGGSHEPAPTSTTGSGEGSGEGEGPVAIESEYPGELISTEVMTRDFLARQQLSGRFGEREFKFEAVLQLRDGTLTVLGLTPFGTKAFVLEQTGTEVSFKPLIDRELPFPPEYMLQDIHRAWFWHLRLPWGDQPPAEASPSVEIAGERVRETWTENGLVRRTFERLDGAREGVIRVDYMGGHRSGRPAKQVVLDNGWFGYRLEITTTQWREL